jgi:hypothetical protein
LWVEEFGRASTQPPDAVREAPRDFAGRRSMVSHRRAAVGQPPTAIVALHPIIRWR